MKPALPEALKKDDIRRRVWEHMLSAGVSNAPHGRIPPFQGQNRAAERLRRWPLYGRARSIMTAPDEAVLQVRINALRDGKRLILASPGLRQGFCELSADRLTPSQWPTAVRPRGVERLGRPLRTRGKDIGGIDLLVTGAVAVDEHGVRLGKGEGYFDLEYVLLDALGCLHDRSVVVCIVHDSQILPEVPLDHGDVPVDWIVTPERMLAASGTIPKPAGIPWKRFDDRQIRRMKPLWELHRARGRRRG